MKKLFSLFAALLFVSSMMAADAIHYAGTIAKADGTGGTDGNENPTVVWTIGTRITVTQYKGIGVDPNSSYAGRVYPGNFLAFTAASGYVIDTVIITLDGAYPGVNVYAGVDTLNNVVTTGVSDDVLEARIKTTSGAKDTLINKQGETLAEFFLQNTKPNKSTKQLRFSSIDVRYTKLATSDPEVSADNVDFGTFVPGVSNPVKELTVLGSNLLSPIVAELKTGSEFSISGDLTADGGTLTVTLTDLEDGDKSDSIRFKVNSILMKKSLISAHVVETSGLGTKDNPFTCPDVAKLHNTFQGNYWMKGYILGGVKNHIIDNTEESAIAMAVTMTNATDTIEVQLPSGAIRNSLKGSVAAGKLVSVYGSLGAYNNVVGVLGVSDYEFDSSTALDETKTAGKATKELRNGQIFILRGDKTYNAQGQLVK